MIKKLYLHWTATPYDWCVAGHYHSIIDDKGECARLTPYRDYLSEHTYGRNRDSTSIAIACMGGVIWKDYPPTEAQIDGLCKESAKVALGFGWKPDKLDGKILTHAEAAACRDYPRSVVALFSGKSPSSDWDHDAQDAGLPHANYGPSQWHDGWPGGDVYRWDLWKLRETDKGGTGGFELRKRIAEWMKKIESSSKK